MKTLATVIATFAGLAPVTAFAANGRADESGFFVWVFLGFCALIVIAQVVPALLLMFGLVKGVSQAMTEKKTVKAKES